MKKITALAILLGFVSVNAAAAQDFSMKQA